MINTTSLIKALQTLSSLLMSFLIIMSVIFSSGTVADTPATVQEILDRYTEVVNLLKEDAPAYSHVKYQQLKVSDCGDSRYKSMLDGTVNGYLTDKLTAQKQTLNSPSGSDMRSLPVVNNAKGCLPIDASCVKFASCKDIGFGQWKIVIVLENEVDPEPALSDAESSPSLHGAMFAPAGRAEIDRIIADHGIFHVSFYAMNYTGCTATLIFNSADNRVVSWEQTENIEWISNLETDDRVFDYTATVVNQMKLYDVVYPT